MPSKGISLWFAQQYLNPHVLYINVGGTKTVRLGIENWVWGTWLSDT